MSNSLTKWLPDGLKDLVRLGVPSRSSLSLCNSPIDGLLERFDRREACVIPTAVVVAHPDDEVVSLSAILPLLRSLTLVHVTDGAGMIESPGRKDFVDARDYSNARFKELRKALATLGVSPARHVRLNIPDGACIDHIPVIAASLGALVRKHELVITHAFEGGHPDHDACALAMSVAIDREGSSASLLEFAGYHMGERRLVTNEFWPAAVSTARLALNRKAAQRKLDAMRAFTSQKWLASTFSCRVEGLRQAPLYDFSAPPPPGRFLYDANGWSITGAQWLARARATLMAVGGRHLANPPTD
jgi:LmbE family N-acetylglucosaminyl deacetylase